MLVYRVEDSTGAGPYNEHTMVGSNLLAEHEWDSGHPSPAADGNLDLVAGFRTYYAGPNVEWLADWFTGFGAALIEADYHVAEYSVSDSDTKIGNLSGQIGFNMDEATQTAIYPIDWK